MDPKEAKLRDGRSLGTVGMLREPDPTSSGKGCDCQRRVVGGLDRGAWLCHEVEIPHFGGCSTAPEGIVRVPS